MPRLVMVVLAVVLLAVVAGGIDGLINGSRIYQGVTLGSIDVSGMTREEARAAVDATYGPRVKEGCGYIFASEEAAQTLDIDSQLAEQDATAEQSSVEEARQNKQLWVAEAGTLGARIPVTELVEEAFSVGRSGGILERAEAAAQGRAIPVRLEFDEEAVEALASDIDETIGDPQKDWGIAIEDGAVSVTEGHDGTIVSREDLQNRLQEGYLSAESSKFSFVAEAHYAPLRIDEASAQVTADFVQAVLDRGVAFGFEGDVWDVAGSALGPWITTTVEGSEGAWRLVPSIDASVARADLLALIRGAGFTSGATVSFQREGSEVWVLTASGSRYPQLADAVAAADTDLFGAFASSGSTTVAEDVPQVTIDWGAAPERSTFEEALDLGLISEISTFTTEYNDSPSTANRRHNIHRAADLLNNSVAPANGGTWSFNDTVGEASVESGFQAAHAIINGEYDDAIGGGICQVATTVFNAVYEAGFPVTERRNHSLYISSYPTGRDAAIAYPDLDLTWENDSSSDVLVRARYTDSTLTVTLYGIDPGYVVTTKTGDWAEGEAYRTKTQVDENEPEGTRYVKTTGADGRSVTVHRTVRDRSGNVRHEEDFTSNYAPIDEVIVVGPNTPTESDQEKEDDGVLPTGD
ncbi:VanW family protein [Adlercreutzia equolifaciens]|uniref:VanW family protein n=1 Tax=Adlercreutzia equolifaciens TaxID=446660 RepID=UPI0023AF173D|nr:VanW family protein [Adlercreutzia equolifaciens]MDE8703171.1 VanW family protein [Adlercreutzia equolifaciens]